MLAISNITGESGLQGWMKARGIPLASVEGQMTAPPEHRDIAHRDSGNAPNSDGRVQHNPVLEYNRDAQVVLVQFIDPATGEVDKQYPSEKQVEAYQKAMEEQKDALPSPSVPTGTARGRAGDQDGVGQSAPAVSGTPDVDPGQATREVSLDA